MSDELEIIRKAQAGCADSFRVLVERFGPPVYRLLRRLSGNRVEDAEDLYQETLLRVSRSLPKYRHQGTFSAWMFRIARNCHLDAVKRKRVEEAPLIEEALPAVHAGPETPSGLDAEVRAAVDALSPKLREVFLLRHYGELSFKEIAAVLEAPLGTVLARMSYAVKALRPRLGHLLEGKEGPKALPTRSRGALVHRDSTDTTPPGGSLRLALEMSP